VIGTVLVVGREGQVVDAVVTALRDNRIEAAGATEDEKAMRILAAGGVGLLVLGAGIGPRSREMLRNNSCGAGVVETPLRGRDADEYVEHEILPRFQDRAPKA
jgi:hypothetical protein